jgi:hypothetical protein
VWYLVPVSGSSSTETTTSTIGPGIAAVKGLTVAFHSNDALLFRSTVRPIVVHTVTIAVTTNVYCNH